MTTAANPPRKVRNSKLEALRILAMLLIVLGHFAYHGISKEFSGYYDTKILVDILALGGKFGVNLFVIISAYFMCDSKFTFKKLLRVVLETWFYSALFLILFKTVLDPVNPIGLGEIAKSIFPTLFGSYWFISCYILLMIFSPFLNIFISKCPKPVYQKFIIVFITLAVLIAGTVPSGLSLMSGNLIWFIGLYLVIGYIKKYVDLASVKRSKNLAVALASLALLVLSSIVLNVVGRIAVGGGSFILANSNFFARANSVFVFVASVELFLFTVKSRPKTNKLINLIASSTLGIYLIHENLFVRPYLWQTIFDAPGHAGTYFVAAYALFATITVFAAGCAIDLIRQSLIEKPLLPVIYRCYDWARAKAEPLYDRLKTSLEKL